MKSNWHSSVITIIFFLTVISLKIGDKNFGKNGNYGVVDWDNFGYYLYLPATFIYNDLCIENTERIRKVQKQYELSSSLYQVHPMKNGKHVIQYTSGMAFIYSPAFFVGHFLASNFSLAKADGFSPPYQLSVLGYSFLILFLGLFYLRKFCLLFFNDRISAIIILLICFGSNFFQIASGNISSPHTFLFSFYCIILYYIYQWHQTPKIKYLLVISTLSGLMILSRPNELLFLIIPLLWKGSYFPTLKDKWNYFLKNPSILIVLIPMLIPAFLQLFYWKTVSGHWVFDSYFYEDFKLLSPYLYEYLFSFKKGWLVYTPLMVLGFIGLYFLAKRNKALFLPTILFLVLYVWLLSSWDNWWYADSFGQRSIVQAYPIFILPLGYFLKSSFQKEKLFHIIPSIALTLIVGLNLFQTYQFKMGIIHPSRMTKAYYLSSFFDVKLNENKQRQLLDIDRDINYFPEHISLRPFIIHREDFMGFSENEFYWENQKLPQEGHLRLSPEAPYSPKFSFPFNKYCDTTYGVFIARIRYYSAHPSASNPFGITAITMDKKSGKKYKIAHRGVKNIDWFSPKSWGSMDLVFIPPYLRNPSDSMHFFLELQGDQSVLIDQFYVELWDPSHQPKLKNKEFFYDYHTLKIGDWSKPKKMIAPGYEVINNQNPYSSTLIIKGGQLCNNSKYTISVNMLYSKSSTQNSFAVLSIENKKGEKIEYKAFPLNLAQNTDEPKWEKQIFNGELTSAIEQDSKLKFYIWNPNPKEIFIRSLSLNFDRCQLN